MTYADMFSKVKGMLMDADVSDIHERRKGFFTLR